MKQEIINCCTWLLNRTAEGYVYTNWDDKIVRKESKEAFDAFYKEVVKFIDFKSLTKEDVLQLRFKKWDDEFPHLWLFPVWMFPIIPEGLTVYDLDANPFEFKRAKADNDSRMGCLSFGLMIGGIDMPASEQEDDEKKAPETDKNKDGEEDKNKDEKPDGEGKQEEK